MRKLLVLLIIMVGISGYAQSGRLFGTVIDGEGNALPSATVVLLNPADSTMQYFSITNGNGSFDIRNITEGNYLLQAAFIGFNSYYKQLKLPHSGNGDLGTLVLLPSPVNMDEVQVTGERIPLKIYKDTIEYDAKAFKTSPDANVEDLLKKLPGVEVDRAGNIKALGEDVNNVLVDGKEFFSGDPKVATKNLPANAVDKVQLYNKKTEEAEFTGIDDGARNQTLNLVLDEDKKQGVFGEVVAGGGTGLHYDGKAKVYKFTDKAQIAGLGMLNNVNKFGFSFSDYLSFTGGIARISHGEGINISGDGFPINFGETVSGYSSSGAAGLNYSYFKSKYQRFFISYLGSGSKRDLREETLTSSFLENNNYQQNEESEQVQRDTSHAINFGARYLFRKTNNIIMDGGISYNTGFIPYSSQQSSYLDNELINMQERTSSDLSRRLSGNINGSYLKKISEGKTLLKFNASTSFGNTYSNTEFENSTNYYNPALSEFYSLLQENSILYRTYGSSISMTQHLFNAIYMDLALKGGLNKESLSRSQLDRTLDDQLLDTLSPEFTKNTSEITPGLAFRRNTEKVTFTIGLDYKLGKYESSLWEDDPSIKEYQHLLPRLSWEYAYKTGRRLSFNYNSRVNTPTVNQLQPVVNNFNNLSLFYGNRDLDPEYIHSVRTNWWIFDQFSFTTLLASLQASYTRDKINYSRTINDQLQQTVRLINTDYDYSLGGNIDFTTPIKVLGIKTNIDISESYSNGINVVNGIENKVSNFNHRYFITFDNRKKDKWDILTGAGLSLTDARYSIQESLNNVYYNLSWFGEIRYNPSEKLEFWFSSDITNYSSQSFDDEVLIPLLGAEISYFFMANNRATLSISGHDLLNRNTGISRVSEMNYLQERRSNIIGRYFMLTFKYRLNKLGGDSGIQVDVKKR